MKQPRYAKRYIGHEFSLILIATMTFVAMVVLGVVSIVEHNYSNMLFTQAVGETMLLVIVGVAILQDIFKCKYFLVAIEDKPRTVHVR